MWTSHPFWRMSASGQVRPAACFRIHATPDFSTVSRQGNRFQESLAYPDTVLYLAAVPVFRVYFTRYAQQVDKRPKLDTIQLALAEVAEWQTRYVQGVVSLRS